MPADNTPAIEAERLLSCPFCGAEPLVNIIEPHRHFLVNLPDHPGSCVIECGCGAGLIDDTQAKVTARWNRRAPPAQAPEAVAALRDGDIGTIVGVLRAASFRTHQAGAGKDKESRDQLQSEATNLWRIADALSTPSSAVALTKGGDRG